MSRIKNLRLERGLTQEQLGKMLDVQKATISKYEKGIVAPSNEVLMKLSSIFDVSIDYLLGKNRGAKSPTCRLASDESNLIDGYRALNPDQRHTLFNMLSFLEHQKFQSVPNVIQNNTNGNNVYANGDYSR